MGNLEDVLRLSGFKLAVLSKTLTAEIILGIMRPGHTAAGLRFLLACFQHKGRRALGYAACWDVGMFFFFFLNRSVWQLGGSSQRMAAVPLGPNLA